MGRYWQLALSKDLLEFGREFYIFDLLFDAGVLITTTVRQGIYMLYFLHTLRVYIVCGGVQMVPNL